MSNLLASLFGMTILALLFGVGGYFAALGRKTRLREAAEARRNGLDKALPGARSSLMRAAKSVQRFYDHSGVNGFFGFFNGVYLGIGLIPFWMYLPTLSLAFGFFLLVTLGLWQGWAQTIGALIGIAVCTIAATLFFPSTR